MLYCQCASSYNLLSLLTQVSSNSKITFKATLSAIFPGFFSLGSCTENWSEPSREIKGLFTDSLLFSSHIFFYFLLYCRLLYLFPFLFPIFFAFAGSKLINCMGTICEGEKRNCTPNDPTYGARHQSRQTPIKTSRDFYQSWGNC